MNAGSFFVKKKYESLKEQSKGFINWIRAVQRPIWDLFPYFLLEQSRMYF